MSGLYVADQLRHPPQPPGLRYGQIHRVLKACTFDLSAYSADYDQSFVTGSFAVSTDAECEWTPVSDSDWLHVDGGGGGGGGTVNYTVDENPGCSSRTGTITVGDKVFTVTQSVSCNNWNGLEWIPDVVSPASSPPDYVMTGTKAANVFTFHYHDTGNNNSGGNRFSAFIPAWAEDACCSYEVIIESTVTPAFEETHIVDRGMSIVCYEADRTTDVSVSSLGSMGFTPVQRINGTQNFPFTIPPNGTAVPGRVFNLVLSWDCRHTPSEPITWDATVTIVTTPLP